MKRFMVFFCILLLPVLLMGEEQKEPGAWVSYIDGKTAVLRGPEGKSERLTQNTIVQEGDRIVTYDSAVEVDLGSGNLLRIWNGSNVGFIYLQNEIRVEIEGDAYLQVEDTGKKLSVILSNSISDIVDPGLYRFMSGKTPEIIVFYGELEAEYKGQKKALRWKDIGLLKGDKVSVCSTDSQFVKDRFDKFNEERTGETGKGAKAESEGRLDGKIRHYEPTLDRYGKWVQTRDHGCCWVPQTTYLVTDWRPYYWGRWGWYNTWGWTWIPYEPWGWVTYHYGLWYWDSLYGWYWRPGAYWSPAWVCWWYDGYHLGWAPRGWYDDYWYAGNYSDNRGWNIIRKDQLQQPGSGSYSASVLRVEQLARSVSISSSHVSATGPSFSGSISVYSSPAANPVPQGIQPQRFEGAGRMPDSNASTRALQPQGSRNVASQQGQQRFYQSQQPGKSQIQPRAVTSERGKYYPQGQQVQSQSSTTVRNYQGSTNRQMKPQGTLMREYMSGGPGRLRPQQGTVGRSQAYGNPGSPNIQPRMSMSYRSGGSYSNTGYGSVRGFSGYYSGSMAAPSMRAVPSATRSYGQVRRR